MRKGFTPAHFLHVRFSAFLLLTTLSLSSTPLWAQQLGQGKFRDGQPRFLLFDAALTQNVALSDTVVSLLAKTNAITDPDTFVLSGVDWRYPSAAPALVSPTDIQKIPESLEPAPGPQDYYLITDATARRIYQLSVSTPTTDNSFGGAPTLDKPVAAIAYADSTGKFKVIITDQAANQVLQVDWTFKTIDWRINNAILQTADQLSAPGDAIPINKGREILICDTGRNRLLIFDLQSNTVVWRLATPVNDNTALNTPVDVEVDPVTGYFVITDKNNHRVLMVDRASSENRWQFGTGQAGNGGSRLSSPTDANALPNGNVLISDAGNKRLIEVSASQKQIIYTFAHPLEDLRAASRIVEDIPDKNKTLVIAGNLPVSQNALPIRLGYKNETPLSDNDNFDFNTPVDFDSLSFPLTALEVPAGTTLRLQLRSANVIAELNNAKWYGPKDTTDFYAGPITAINPVHDGHRFMQYRAYLNNDDNAQKKSDPLLTPRLRQVKISAHFFDTNTTGTLTSTVIRDTSQQIITTWKRLIVHSVVPAEPQQRSQVQITLNVRDEANQNTLFSAPLSSTANLNQFDLSLINLLRRKQAVRLQAVLKTNNAAISPRLNDWELEWENTKSTVSTLAFTDPNGNPVDFYRVAAIADNPPLNLGTVFLSLDDMNLLPVEDAVNLLVRATTSADTQTVRLTEQPTGLFLLTPGYPAVMISDAPSRRNVLEGRSRRDTLAVRYVDPTDPTDISIARVLLIQNVKGQMLIEKRSGGLVDSVSVGDSIFVHLTGETDRDVSPAIDSLVVKFLNTNISDTESLTLYEVPNGTGEFRSRFGIPFVKSAGGLVNDGKLQVSGGEQVRIEFVDLDGSILQQVIRVRTIIDEPRLRTLAGNKAFEFLIAPNPYNARQHANVNDGLRLGVVANNGDVLIHRIEIYNLAGERVRSLEGGEVPFQKLIGRGEVAATQKGSYWWNLRTDAGAAAASGTYWAKIYLRYTDGATGAAQETTALRKFVIVQ